MLFTPLLEQKMQLLMNALAKKFELMDTHVLPQAKPPSEHSA